MWIHSLKRNRHLALPVGTLGLHADVFVIALFITLGWKRLKLRVVGLTGFILVLYF